jgi:hypothetical protein
LRIGAGFFVLGYLAHFADHLARGLSLTPIAVLVAGSVGAIPGVLSVVLVLRRDPVAPLLACVTGALFAVGFLAVHLPPKWGPLSEPFRSGVTFFDWLSLVLGAGGGLALAFAAVYAMRLAERAKTTTFASARAKTASPSQEA